jgi:beta-lactamase class A
MVAATSLRSQVEEIVSEFSGRVSVSASNLVSGERLDINDSEVFPALSAIKLGIMAELFFQIEEEGKIALTDEVTVNQSDLRLGTGVFREFETPFEITVKDVCMMMVVVSDNTCTWLLSDLVGKDRINARMRTLGMNEYSLNSDLGADTFDELAGKDIDAYSECSSRDFTSLVTSIAQGTLVSVAASAQMLDIMGRCQHIEWLGRYLPLNQFPAEAGIEPTYKLYNKLGAYLHGRCDTGLITGPNLRYVITVMTADSKDPTAMLCEHEGSRTIGRISKAVFDAWSDGETNSEPTAG